jgi:N-acyl-L-homoserine lactone synthetase
MSFTGKLVSDEKDLKAIYRLRYRIYCSEWGFEKPENYPDEMITDVYDKNSLQFAVKDDAQKIIGAISLILHSSEGFPTEKYCELNLKRDPVPRESVAEISRLAIHRNYRRRAEDKYIYGPDEERRSIGTFDFPSGYSNQRGSFRRADDRYRNKNSRNSNDAYSERRRRNEVVCSLYKAVYKECKRRQITHWYAVMTKGVVMLLNKMGLTFDVIGDPVDYHGIRTPYLGDITKMEQNMMDTHPEVYREFSEDI